MYKEIFEQSADGMLIIEDGKIIDCNQSALSMLAYETKEHLLNTPFEQLNPSYQPDGKKSSDKALENKKFVLTKGSRSFEWIHLKADGTPFYVEVVLSKLSHDNKLRLLAVWREISIKKKLEAENAYQRMLLHSVLNSTDDIIFYKEYHDNIDGIFIGCNPAYEALVGKPQKHIIGHNDFDLFGKSQGAIFREHDKEVMDKQIPLTLKVWLSYPNGDKALFHTVKSPLIDAQGNCIGVIGVSRDITASHNYQEALKESAKKNKILANTDPLTGIMNRRAIFDASNTLFQADEIAVLMLDVDNFKHINDTYGHEAGDTVLKHIVSICAQNLREEDVLGRMGGEEFLIILNNTHKNRAKDIASRLIKGIANEKIGKEEITVTVSIGMVLSDTNKYNSFSEILNDADTSLYEAKASGKNQYQLFTLSSKNQTGS